METILGSSRTQVAYHIGELSEIASARRAAVQLAQRLGFDETAVGQVALVVTEAGTNIAKHAGDGEILLQSISNGDALGVEVLAIDRGPGMTDPEQSMRDGSSSVGTYGVGLGAMQRLSAEFDIYSSPGKGTAIRTLIRGSADAQSRSPQSLQLGTVCIAYPGETECGDSWMAAFDDQEATFMVCDGLGHGPQAALASGEAIRVASRLSLPPAAILQQLHLSLRSTRGAAAAVARLDREAGEVLFCGVGNIAASIMTDGRRHQLVSHNGIVGGNVHKVQSFASPWERGSIFIAHSDGLSAKWNLSDYPGLASHHPGLIAAVLYRDFGRRNDDRTVLVIREGDDS